MKTLEEQIGGKCKNFNGIMNTTCKCGINYKEAFGEKPILKMPCIKDRMTHLTDEIIPCEKLEFPTFEEVKSIVEEKNKGMRLTLTAFATVKQHIQKTNEKRGSIKCPNGDHNLNYSSAECNGHVRIFCKECEISVIE